MSEIEQASSLHFTSVFRYVVLTKAAIEFYWRHDAVHVLTVIGCNQGLEPLVITETYRCIVEISWQAFLTQKLPVIIVPFWNSLTVLVALCCALLVTHSQRDCSVVQPFQVFCFHLYLARTAWTSLRVPGSFTLTTSSPAVSGHFTSSSRLTFLFLFVSPCQRSGSISIITNLWVLPVLPLRTSRLFDILSHYSYKSQAFCKESCKKSILAESMFSLLNVV